MTVALASSSARGELAADAAGPWTATLSLTVPTGATTATFHSRDTLVGSPVLSATATGRTAATQTSTIGDALDRDRRRHDADRALVRRDGSGHSRCGRLHGERVRHGDAARGAHLVDRIREDHVRTARDHPHRARRAGPRAAGDRDLLLRNGSGYATGSGTTGSDGRLVLTTGSLSSACYSTTLRSVALAGYAWDTVTPANKICI